MSGAPPTGLEVFFEQYFNFDALFKEVPNTNETWFEFILDGFLVTLELSLIGGVLSLAWGLILAVIRQLPGRAMAPVRAVTIGYIDAFRGVPLLLVLLLISGSLPPIVDALGLPAELGAPDWLGRVDAFWYGILGITLTYGAYMAEVYRAGIEAVPEGQMEAARSLGMSHGKAMRFVIVPQAVRKVVPPLLNDFIALMKDTSLLYALALTPGEVVNAGQDMLVTEANSTGFVFGAVLFLIVTIPLARLVDWLIKRDQAKSRRGGGGVAGPPVATEPAGGPAGATA